MRWNLRHATAFIAVAEHLSFSRAAAQLNTAQPAVSRTVREFEDILGVELLWRSTRTVQLTQAGRQLSEDLRGLLRLADTAERTAKLIGTGAMARLRVGYTTINGHSLLPAIVREATIRNPHIAFDLTFAPGSVQRDMLLDNKLDFALVENSYQNAAITSIPVMATSLNVITRRDHSLQDLEEIRFGDLTPHQYISGTAREWPNLSRIIARAFASNGLSTPQSMEVSSLTGILGLVAAGMGYSIFAGIPRFCEGSDLSFRPLKGGNETRVLTYLSWRKHEMPSAIQSFITLTRELTKSEELCQAVQSTGTT